ncbi:MAG: hypothetical protein DRK00_06385 [Thermoprotei archaeon]|nr:MAG: hypothetical protein DRK00_06385 [Thermoprotei archaeon]
MAGDHRLEGLMIVGFMLVGMGAGMLLGNSEAGMLVGMGVGFIAAALLGLRRAPTPSQPSSSRSS